MDNPEDVAGEPVNEEDALGECAWLADPEVHGGSEAG